MDSAELAELMKQVEEKGIAWDTVKEKTKVSRDVMELYVKSGPVPVTLINNLKKVLEEGAQ
jgi:hypothetical protein